MKYIFPLQFGLHNVFTSKVNPKETTQPFKDYTLREQEIAQQGRRLKQKAPNIGNIEDRVPKRLRGECLNLVKHLQKRNHQCSFPELLKHYCSMTTNGSSPTSKGQNRCHPKSSKRSNISRPSGTQKPDETTNLAARMSNAEHDSIFSDTTIRNDNHTRQEELSFTHLATSHAHVSAFCRASILKLIPKAFWGGGDAGRQNQITLMRNIDCFIRLRRFEAFSLHAATQGMKVRYDQKHDNKNTYPLIASLHVLVVLQQCCIL